MIGVLVIVLCNVMTKFDTLIHLTYTVANERAFILIACKYLKRQTDFNNLTFDFLHQY